jgi:transglutaminase-like putative cysteine protease
LPTLVPLVVALSERPTVGKRFVLPVFDPNARASRSIGYTIRAESLFVLSDSAVLDTTVAPAVWRGVHPDTVRAWEIGPDSGVAIGFAGWVDEQGRIVATSQLGLQLRRVPYELAFRNWQNDPTAHASDSGRVIGTTALAAGKTPHSRIESLVARVDVIDPKVKLRLNGPGQRATGDTVFVTMAADSAISGGAALPPPAHTTVGRQAAAITRAGADAPVAVRRLVAWVHDSIRPHVAYANPTFQQTMESRNGDCNEMTQVFVALARARGLNVRAVSGLLYVDGKLYYHSWAEVLLKDWVAVDPMLGQAPADAAHIRLMPGFALRTDLVRRWTGIDIEVVSVNEAPRKPSETSHR